MRTLDFVVPIIKAHQDELRGPGVVLVRPGYKVANNWPTREPAIVVVVSRAAGPLSLPHTIENIPVDVRKASAVEELRFRDPATYNTISQHRAEYRGGAFFELDPVADGASTTLLEASAPKKQQIPYTPAAMPLKPVTGEIQILCHVSPDAGWPVLSSFLAGVHSTLSVGLYDFTSKHILDAISQDLSGKRSFELVLDHPPLDGSADQSDPQTVADLSSTLGNEFHQAWALVRSNPAIQRFIYPTAYHIKVAVRDSKSVWLSSGNWNNSNQPAMDPIGNPQPTDQQLARKSDRDWHVVINSPSLAKQFEAYINHDFTVAASEEAPPALAAPQTMELATEDLRVAAEGTFEFHPPLVIAHERLTIIPVLTPDAGSYQPAMLNLINSAQTKLYIQLQYIHPPAAGVDDAFHNLLDAVIQKIKDGKDVRIICGEFQATNGWLERLQEAGVDLSKVKIQNGVHNKGFVVDGSVVAVGSQNWSGDGVLRNRDATVIIESKSAAAYYETIFLHDWDRLAAQKMS